MRKTKQDNRSTRRTRAAIRQALLDGLEHKPVAKITVQELIDRANICRTTFYAHYKDIYDLLEEVETDILDEMRDELNALGDEPIRVEHEFSAIQTVVDIYARHAETIRLLNGENGDPEFDERLQAIIYEITRRRRMEQEGAAFNDDRHRLYSCYVISGGISVLNRLLAERLPWDAAHTARILGAMAATGEQVFLAETLDHTG